MPQAMQEGAYDDGAKLASAPQPNTEAVVVLAKEMEHRGAEARQLADFHHREASLFASVADACNAALESLHRPRDDDG
jgi:hypothetical protein